MNKETKSKIWHIVLTAIGVGVAAAGAAILAYLKTLIPGV